MKALSHFYGVPAAVVFLILVGCGAGDDGTPIETSSVTFHVKMIGDATGIEDFRVVTSDQVVIASAREQLARPESERNKFITGYIAEGNGGFNLNWHWHFVPDTWKLTEVATELCDTGPVLIEQMIQYWVEARGGACPWGSYIAYEASR